MKKNNVLHVFLSSQADSSIGQLLLIKKDLDAYKALPGFIYTYGKSIVYPVISYSFYVMVCEDYNLYFSLPMAYTLSLLVWLALVLFYWFRDRHIKQKVVTRYSANRESMTALSEELHECLSLLDTRYPSLPLNDQDRTGNDYQNELVEPIFGARQAIYTDGLAILKSFIKDRLKLIEELDEHYTVKE